MSRRQRFVQDSDGHWYLIYAEQDQAFERWDAYTNGNGSYSCENFEPYRLAGSPTTITFVDPQED